MDSLYAFIAIVRDSQWDSQDDQYFYKKYHFLAIEKNSLKYFEQFLKAPDRQKLAPMNYHAATDLSNVETLAKGIASFHTDLIVKFYKKTSEIVREMKDLYFFY